MGTPRSGNVLERDELKDRRSVFLKRLAEDIERQALLEANETVVVGVSGGPDSMALLFGLHLLNESGRLPLRPQVAHLNHQLRGAESDGDAAFVSQQAERLGLPAFVECEDIRALSGEGRGSVEEVARNRRYEFLGRMCVKVGSRAVAVAHHADDNAETVLQRIVRGTGLRGLGGIRPMRPLRPGSNVRLVRPLLGFRKSEIMDFLAEQEIPFRQDASNLVGDYTRTRIRQRVLPVLASEVNPQVVEALLRLSEQARLMDAFLRERAAQILETVVVSRNDREVVLNVHPLIRKSRVIRTEVIRQALQELAAGEQDIGYAHLSNVTDLAERSAGGKELHLPGGIVVRKEYDRLVLRNTTDEPRESCAVEVAVRLPGVTTLPVRRMEISVECAAFDAAAFARWREQRSNLEEVMDQDAVSVPLTVRSRREGDRFWPLGAPGSKKLSDFLSERRVRPADRDRVAVLCDRLGPVWIIPYRIDDRVKVTRSTRHVLKLSARFLAQPP